MNRIVTFSLVSFLFLLFSISSFCSVSCVASSCLWIGSSNGIWDVSTNWNCSAVPSVNDDVYFQSSSSTSYSISFTNAVYSISSLTFRSTPSNSIVSAGVTMTTIFSPVNVTNTPLIQLTMNRFTPLTIAAITINNINLLFNDPN